MDAVDDSSSGTSYAAGHVLCRQALATPPESRSHGTGAAAREVQQFLSTLEIFRAFSADELAQWACAVDYGHIEEEEAQTMDGDSWTVFASGDTDVSTFYIVLSGTISLSLPAALKTEAHVSAAAGSSQIGHPAGTSSRPPRLKASPTKWPPTATTRPGLREDLVAELGPGDSFGEEAILALADRDRGTAEALESLCALDHEKRRYTAKRVSSSLEFLAVRDPAALSMLLRHGAGELHLRPSLCMAALQEDPSLRTALQQATVARVLNSAGIFSPYRSPSAASLSLLASHTSLLQLGDGELLYSKGDEVDFVYCLLSGAVNISHPDGEGAEAGGENKNTRKGTNLRIQQSGITIGKLVEAYVGHQDEHELHLQHVAEAANHLAEREVESLEVDALQGKLAQTEAELGEQRQAHETNSLRIQQLNLEVKQEQTKVDMGGSREKLDSVMKELKWEYARLETIQQDRAVLQAKVLCIQKKLASYEEDDKLHADQVQRSQLSSISSDQNAMRRHTQILGHRFDGELQSGNRRSFSAQAAAACLLLRFPLVAWQEFCMDQEIFLSFKTFARQLEQMDLSQANMMQRAGDRCESVEIPHGKMMSEPTGDDSAAPTLSAHVSAESITEKQITPTDGVVVSHVEENDLYLAANLSIFLSCFDVLSQISPHNLLKLALRSRLRVFEPRTLLTTQGLAPPSVNDSQAGYLILLGRVHQHKHALGAVAAVDSELWRKLQVNEGGQEMDPFSAAQASFGDLVSFLGHGDVVGDNLSTGMASAKSSSTCLCATRVWVLEVSLKVLHDVSTEADSLIGRPRLAAAILAKPPQERHEADLKILVGCLNRVPFFETFPCMALIDVCRKMSLRSLIPGQILFKQDDEAAELFIILSGSLNVYSLLDSSGAEVPVPDEHTKHSNVPYASKANLPIPDSMNDDADPNTEQPESGSVGIGHFIGKCRVAESVGQAVCFSRNVRTMRRNTTVKACERSTLAVVDVHELVPFKPFLNVRALFRASRIANALAQPRLRSDDDLLAIGEFLRRLDLLGSLDTSELMTLAKRVKAFRGFKGQEVYSCQDRVTHFYFLAEGAAVICRPNPTSEPSLIQRENMAGLDSRHLHLNENHFSNLCSRGAISEFVLESDSLVRLQTGRGKRALETFVEQPQLQTHSCLLAKSSLVLSLSLRSASECLAEWKREAAEDALAILSTIFPFSSWKQKELMLLAGTARCLDYQLGDFIFEQGRVADTIMFTRSGEVSLHRKAMSHVVPAARSTPSKAGLSAETRPANIAVATVAAGSLLGLELVLQLDEAKGKTLASKIKDVDAQIAGVQGELAQAQKDANMSRSALTAVRTKLNSLTRQKGDLIIQQNKVNTQGMLLYKYRAVAATSNVRVLSIRRADVESFGPRGSLLQLEEHYRKIVDRRKKAGSEIETKHELLSSSASSTIISELGGAGRGIDIQDRRRFVGDVRVCAALAGSRSGLLPAEDLLLTPQQALGSLINMRKWLRRKYGKLSSGVSVLTSFYGGLVVPERALKDLCENSQCGLKPPQLRAAITQPSFNLIGGGECHDETDEFGRPVISWADLKQTLDSEDAIIDAAMRITTSLQLPPSGDNLGINVSVGDGVCTGEAAVDKSLQEARDLFQREAVRPSSAMSAKSERPARGKALDSPFRHSTTSITRPKSALEKRSGWASTPRFEMDPFEGEFGGTLFSSRSQMINGLKHSLGIKTDKIRNTAGPKPAKLEQIRSDYAAFKGARPLCKGSLGLSLEMKHGLRTAKASATFRQVPRTRGDLMGIKSPAKIHTGYTRRQVSQELKPQQPATRQEEESVHMSIQLRLPH